MPQIDRRIDAYIERSAEFAQPILTYLREVVHTACPEVEETIKWGMPHFTYGGILCHMAAFKEHCAFGFWKGALVLEREIDKSASAMGQFGRITSIEDLPPREVLIEYIHHAMRLNEEGVKTSGPRKSKAAQSPEVPDYFLEALRQNEQAEQIFESLPPSHKREYIEWLEEAKRDTTRQRRLETAIEWIAEGKSRNWKYMK